MIGSEALGAVLSEIQGLKRVARPNLSAKDTIDTEIELSEDPYICVNTREYERSVHSVNRTIPFTGLV